MRAGDEGNAGPVGLRAHVGMSATHNSLRPRATKRRLTSSAGYASRGADVVLKDLIGAARLPVLCFQLADMSLLIADRAALIAPVLLHSAPRCATPVGGPLARPPIRVKASRRVNVSARTSTTNCIARSRRSVGHFL